MSLARLAMGLPALAVTLVVGCGGVGAGDYVAYRIASEEGSESGDCADDDPSSEHSSNLRSGATAVIYNAPEEDGEDALYLDLGGSVLPGGENDDGTYTFSGETKDVQSVDPAGTTKVTQTVTITVDITFDGDYAYGLSTAKTKQSCSGNCTGFSDYNCTVKTDFVAVEVDPESVSFPLAD